MLVQSMRWQNVRRYNFSIHCVSKNRKEYQVSTQPKGQICLLQWFNWFAEITQMQGHGASSLTDRNTAPGRLLNPSGCIRIAEADRRVQLGPTEQRYQVWTQVMSIKSMVATNNTDKLQAGKSYILDVIYINSAIQKNIQYKLKYFSCAV